MDYYCRKLPRRYDETVKSRTEGAGVVLDEAHIILLEEVSKPGRKGLGVSRNRTRLGERPYSGSQKNDVLSAIRPWQLPLAH